MQANPIVRNFHFSDKNPTPKTIVTHTNPDLDAIAYAWLMAKYAPGFGAYKIEFESIANPDRNLLEQADSVGDIGGEYDPARWRFDHHHLPGAESTATCATRMVWEHLLSLGIDVAHLEPLIEVVHQGDLGYTDAAGIHAILWGFGIRFEANNNRRLTDQEMAAWGFEILDCAGHWLKRKAELSAELSEKVIWKSDDRLIWAVENGSHGTSFAAYAEGARLIVFFGKPIDLPEGTTYPVGVSRAPEWQEPNLNVSIGHILHMADHYPPEVIAEIESWFVHPAGFFSGRGTAKGPMFEPPRCSLLDLATAIDHAWRRREVTE